MNEISNLRHQPIRFNSLALANSYANRCIKMHMVMLGDDSKYWVCCFADAQKLEKIGYEIAA